MKMRKGLRSGYEFTMSRWCATRLINELSNAILHANDNEFSGTFAFKCDLVDGKKVTNVINQFRVEKDVG